MHGAFADASSWNGVVTRLQQRGYTVVAPAVALRGIASDSAYLARVIAQIDGPVVLVGHSYGGALISDAATDAADVRALVFVSGFAPEERRVPGRRCPSTTASPGGRRPRGGRATSR